MRGDETVGVLQLDLERHAGQDVGYIPFVYMTPQHRKQGLGVQLIGAGGVRIPASGPAVSAVALCAG